MKSFQELYKDKYASEQKVEKSASDEWVIMDNPIMAFVRGVSEDRIKQVLLANDWTPSEITTLLRQAKEAKANAKR